MKSKLKLENESLESKNRKLRSECEEKIEEKNTLTNIMKDLKHKIEEFQFKEQLIQHEKVQDADNYINFINSLKKKILKI